MPASRIVLSSVLVDFQLALRSVYGRLYQDGKNAFRTFETTMQNRLQDAVGARGEPLTDIQE